MTWGEKGKRPEQKIRGGSEWAEPPFYPSGLRGRIKLVDLPSAVSRSTRTAFIPPETCASTGEKPIHEAFPKSPPGGLLRSTKCGLGGSFHPRFSSAAATNPLKRGCGAVGLLWNSG